MRPVICPDCLPVETVQIAVIAVKRHFEQAVTFPRRSLSKHSVICRLFLIVQFQTNWEKIDILSNW